MLVDEHDAAYLWDMLEHARIVRDITLQVNFQDYMKNKTLQLAVERGVEIIGEAASHVSKEFQKAHQEIAWRGIIAQRNILAHEYGEIRHERLWGVITKRIPELIDLLEKLDLPDH